MQCLAKYKDVFGLPGEGFHKSRIFGLAFNDLVGTFLLAYIVAACWNLNYGTTLFSIFITGELLHIIFGVETPLSTFG